MEFLRSKIIVKKDEEGNYILKKKANISLILSLLILFFLIFKGLKRMEKMKYLFNIEYIGANIVAFFIFFLYFYVICIFFSKEIFEFKNKEIKIKKHFLFFCYLKKTIKIKEIVKVKYISTGGIFSVILLILLAGIFFKDNIQIQANTGLDEDEAFYFGAIIGFEGYRKFCEIFRKVTNRDRANIYFLEEENESYNI
ncbi:hypothetical protein [Fusobacterium animalis]|uniref:Uncharacterized protein n=1 Tax=Fusobacterium animalis TaxID=76859 RepID=A0A2B7YXR8_9FUSO|nr:hypothetical protein [Fusobacterium animalis]PGH25642.1 hypothetical protein RN90_09900 [Fusobacterium animalis]